MVKWIFFGIKCDNYASIDFQIYNYIQIQSLPGEEITYRAEDKGDQDELRNCGADKSITLKVISQPIYFVPQNQLWRCHIKVYIFLFFLHPPKLLGITMYIPY